jgi:hypothetical protein
MSFFSGIKDSAVSFAAEKIIKQKIKRYGDMLDFKIDSMNKKIDLKIILAGESEPLFVTINEYEFLETDNDSFIVVRKIVTSKEWMNLLIEDFLKEKKIQIPAKYTGLMKMVLW